MYCIYFASKKNTQDNGKNGALNAPVQNDTPTAIGVRVNKTTINHTKQTNIQLVKFSKTMRETKQRNANTHTRRGDSAIKRWLRIF